MVTPVLPANFRSGSFAGYRGPPPRDRIGQVRDSVMTAASEASQKVAGWDRMSARVLSLKKHREMFSKATSKVALALVVPALLAWACVAHSPHLQVWVLAAGLLAGCVLILVIQSVVEERARLASQLTERTSQLDEEKLALEQAQRDLQLLATHDRLTGVWNRAAILEHMERELVRAQREETALAVAIADLDHFRLINDTQGHLCGDRVLRDAAQRLAFCLREYDSIGRYSGEEFLILMPGYDPAEASGRLDDLVASVHGHRFHDGDRVVQTSCSIGATVFRPAGRGASIEELLTAADAALYRAKAAGRNCSHFAELAELQRVLGRA